MMKNSAYGIQREIKVKGQKLEKIISFKYVETVFPDDDTKP